MGGKIGIGRGVILGVCVACALVAGLWGLRERSVRMQEQTKVEARKAFLARFGIVSAGTNDFEALPPILPHARGPARLGGDLFCDHRLAQSHRRACSGCHLLNEGGVDGECHGGVLTRTVMNAVFCPIFLHDGSLTNLEDVVERMITRREFSGGGSLARVMAKLEKDEKLVKRFQANYPTGLVASNVVQALVENFRACLTPKSPFDRYWSGDVTALTDQQRKGMRLFKRQDCLACHDGPALGGLRVSKGRKVPMLRGLSFRHVYLTDGSQTNLESVVSQMPNGKLEPAQQAALSAFLGSL